MKKLFPLVIIFGFTLVGAGCQKSSVIADTNKNTFENLGIEEKSSVTRKQQLELEGFINDYFYRRQIKDPDMFGDFNAYGSVLGQNIVVYVYPKTTISQGEANIIEEMITKGLGDTLLDFPDFDWTNDYVFSVVVRN